VDKISTFCPIVQIFWQNYYIFMQILAQKEAGDEIITSMACRGMDDA
jgi:hypothetical protein